MGRETYRGTGPSRRRGVAGVFVGVGQEKGQFGLQAGVVTQQTANAPPLFGNGQLPATPAQSIRGRMPILRNPEDA